MVEVADKELKDAISRTKELKANIDKAISEGWKNPTSTSATFQASFSEHETKLPFHDYSKDAEHTNGTVVVASSSSSSSSSSAATSNGKQATNGKDGKKDAMSMSKRVDTSRTAMLEMYMKTGISA